MRRRKSGGICWLSAGRLIPVAGHQASDAMKVRVLCEFSLTGASAGTYSCMLTPT
ncbi:MAG: hypothetical protein WAX07_04405 [Candidatus Altiarchaeia archaeon]